MINNPTYNFDEYIRHGGAEQWEKAVEEGYEIIQPTYTNPMMHLVQILGTEPASMEELTYRIGLGNRTVLFNEHYLAPAIEAGLIQMCYPNSLQHPKQKYMLTEKGLAYYNN